MKSIIRFIRSYIDFCLIYVILGFISFAVSTATSSPSCGLYGAPPCRFLPAPPGQTPSCARPGKTYCEHIDNYPILLIKHLVQKWGYEAKNLLVDETWDDFAAVAWHNTPVFYDPAYIFSQRNPNGNGQTFNGYNYEMSPFASGDNMRNYNDDPSPLPSTSTTEGPTYLLYTSAGQRLSIKKNQVATFDNNGKTTPNNRASWLKRIVRDLSKTSPTEIKVDSHLIIDNLKENNSHRLTHDVSSNMDFLDIMGVDRSTKTRAKRQSPGQTSLCQTTSRFITPQAALNSKDDRHLRHQVLKRETKVQSEATVRSKLPYYRDAERECDRLKRLYGNRDEKYSDLRRSRKEDFRKQKPRESFSKRANDRNGHRSRRTDRGKRNYKPKREKSPHRQTASVARKSPQSSMETKIVYVPLPILTCPYPYWRPNFYDGYFRSNWTRPNQNFHRETFYHNKINSRMQ